MGKWYTHLAVWLNGSVGIQSHYGERHKWKAESKIGVKSVW